MGRGSGLGVSVGEGVIASGVATGLVVGKGSSARTGEIVDKKIEIKPKARNLRPSRLILGKTLLMTFIMTLSITLGMHEGLILGEIPFNTWWKQ